MLRLGVAYMAKSSLLTWISHQAEGCGVTIHPTIDVSKKPTNKNPNPTNLNPEGHWQ